MKVLKRVLFFIVLFVVSMNLGKILGTLLFNFILWSGSLPYLEKFFKFIVL